MKGILEGLGWAAILTAVVVGTFGLGLLPVGLFLFLIFSGAAKRAEKASALLRTTLMRDEQLIEEAIQHRIFALARRRALIAITNSRVLLMRRGLLGGFKMQDIQWKDLRDAKIEQNVLPQYCGSNLTFGHLDFGVGSMAIDGIEDRRASDIYGRAQAEEQAWDEKRRVRAMEEIRAASGGVVIHTAGPPAAAPSASEAVPSGHPMFDALERAKRLLDMGAISDAEYQEMKAKILASV